MIFASDRAREAFLLAAAAVVFLGTIVSPPALMDDVDATYAQIARTMLDSGDWTTARIDGVKYFDKPPGQVWAMAACYAIFGVHDWAARIPLALSCIGLAWLVWRFGRWAFGSEAGFWAGLMLTSCVGMWLFSRVRIPDPALTLAIATALYAAMRLLGRRSPAAPVGGVMWLCSGLGRAVEGVAGAGVSRRGARAVSGVFRRMAAVAPLARADRGPGSGGGRRPVARARDRAQSAVF
ncbi:MAG: glycosyltransferase family 39 protein [Bryobacterales bacterium]